MLKIIVLALFALLTFSFATAQATAQKKASTKPEKSAAIVAAGSATGTAARLPVKRVVLYKNGVGYFEHSARVHGNQELSIDFTTAQLNDVLKSLTAVDMGEGHISSVRYNSIAPLDERLKALRLPFGEQITQAGFLTALRGARVEVRSGSGVATGRLLSVETEQRTTDKGISYQVTKLSVITDSGEMHNFELGPGISVRLVERDLDDEVGKYLNLIGSSRARDLRRMTISATGDGDRDVFVSYISEVPVWKSTYRIILPDKPTDKPLLQGWAIVDNTVGEDWKDVQLSLVAGAPQSFVENISQPFYTRRPVVELPPSVMLTPQAHEGTLQEGDRLEQYAKLNAPPPVAATSLRGTVTDQSGAVVPGARVTVRNDETGASQTTTTDARGIYQFYNVPTGNSALFVDSPGFRRFDLTNFYIGVGRSNEIDATLQVGTANESVEVQASAATVQADTAEISSVAAKQHVEAEGKDLGDYFEYRIKQPITIGKNQSALVPILQARIEAENVSLWNENSKEIRRALWVTNTSGLTLDSGTFNILDGDTFAGEGLLETVHPTERRLISYAADPALRIAMDAESNERPATHVRIAKGIMYLTREQHDSRKYTIHNADTSPRQVIIEHPARDGWKLTEGAKPEETSESFQRFRVAVGPGQTEILPIEEYHPEENQYELSELDDDQVKLISEQKRITPELQAAFREVLDQKNKISGLAAQINSRQQEINAITKDQDRVRENMKALKGSPEEKALLQRYTHQLDSQEDRLDVLKKEIPQIQAKQSQAEEELDLKIQQITLDQNF
ncbi:MAG TPA: carboxypeptidase regulatory-like domain-containing protein [Terriglobales bacterium]|jgi:hypothetical protein|nr:carboxypeptidase regulatory-like domain-containing protein [Terriglobales bacterium]